MDTNSFWPSRVNWKRHWPAGINSIIGVIQLFISFAILVIHAAIVGIGVASLCIGAAPWFIMGFVCWAFFLACCISIFCVTCCNRSSVGCATYAMIKNILAFIFSAVLIDFDRKFIDGQTDSSYLGYYIAGCSPANSGTDWGAIMLSLAKGQLAGAVIILVSSLVFVGIYVYVYIRALMDGRRGFNDTLPTGTQQTVVVQQPKYMNPNPPRFDDHSRTIVCHRCGAIVEASDRF